MITLFEGFELEGLDQHTWLKGQLIYAKQDWHEVSNLDVAPSGNIELHGKVLGSSRTPYRQHIRLVQQRSGKWSVHSECSCPVGFNCKHVASILLFAKTQLRYHKSTQNSPEGGLTLDLRVWLDRWQQTRRLAVATKPQPSPAKRVPPVQYRLFYLLYAEHGRLWVSLHKIRSKDLDRMDTLANPPPLEKIKKPVATLINELPNYIDPETDLPILQAIAPMGNNPHSSQHLTFPITGHLGQQILKHLNNTHRIGHHLPKGSLFSWSAGKLEYNTTPKELHLSWRETEGSTTTPGAAFQLEFNLASSSDEPHQLVFLPEPHLYLSQENRLQCVHSPVDEYTLLQLTLMPAVPMHAAQAMAETLAPTLPEAWAHTTARLANIQTLNTLPNFRARLTRTSQLEEQNKAFAFWPYPCPIDGDRIIVLEMRYGESGWMGVPSHQKSSLLKIDSGQGTPVRHIRHTALEQNTLDDFCMNLPTMSWMLWVMMSDQKERLVDAVDAMGREPDDKDLIFSFCRVPKYDSSWPALVQATHQWCTSKKIEFVIDQGSEIVHHPAAQIEMALDHSQQGWLDASFTIALDGHPVNLAEVLHQTLSSNPDLLNDIAQSAGTITVCIDEDQGIYADLGADQLKPILHLLHRLLNGNGNTLPLHNWELGELQAISGQLPVSAPNTLIDVIKNFDEVIKTHRVEISPLFKARLRPYQQEGVAWVQLLAKLGMHGLLADDMGLGKTIQTLAVLSNLSEGQMALVIAPNSLVHNWASEARQFLPHFTVLCLGAGHQPPLDGWRSHQLVVCPFSMVHRLQESLETIQWSWLVVDESQRIKNANTQTAKAIKQIRATHRLALSGTPIENHLGELWSQMDFLMPGLLGTRKEFDTHWRKPIEKNHHLDLSKRLATRIKPFIKRRTKTEVAQDLPEKTEQIIRVPLNPKQAQAYETVRAAMDKRMRELLNKQGFAKSQIVFLEALLRLRQICCDPALVDSKAPSAKLELLLDLVQTLVEEKRTVLVFSQFAEMLHRIETALAELQIACLKLTGQTKDREKLLQQFREGQAPVFLISLKAGGVGLNLTEADTVIMFDPWWNPAAEQQAVDRAHRIGQTRQVSVIRLIAENTVEEKILKLQDRKNDLAQQILQGKQLDTQLTEEDFLQMLAAQGEEKELAT